jgi:YVTN family beta-propeller protein
MRTLRFTCRDFGLLLLGALAFLVLGRFASAESYNFYVGNSAGDDITVIRLKTLSANGSIKVAPHIHGVAVSSDGKLLFTTVESDYTLRIVDVVNRAEVGQVKLTGRPNQCAVTPDTRYVIVPLRDKDTVDIVDVGKRVVVKSLAIAEPHNAVSVDSDRFVYVSSMGGNEIDKIDLSTLSFADHIGVGGRPRPFVVSRDGKKLYVALANLHGFAIIDENIDHSVSRIALPSTHHGDPKPRPFETPDTLTHGLALTPDESELWVTSLLDDAIYVYDLHAKKVVATLPTGDGPNWIVFTPDGKFAGVTNTDSNDVSLYETRIKKEVARVPVGNAPKRIAVGIDVDPRSR